MPAVTIRDARRRFSTLVAIVALGVAPTFFTPPDAAAQDPTRGSGLPVEITQEFDNWRKIRDSEGSEGWVFHSLLSGRRTGLVAPWVNGGNAGPFAAHTSADAKSTVVAYLEPKVIATVEECHTGWCLVSGTRFRGWIEQERLWGVYPNEDFSE